MFLAIAGPVGQRQVDAAQPDRLHRHARRAGASSSTATTPPAARPTQLADLRARTIGFVFQTFNLLPGAVSRRERRISAAAVRASSAATSAGARGGNARSRASQVARAASAQRAVGGQRQRVAIARALVTRPRIILADEPTANLDSKTGEGILELMKHINRPYGTTFVFSTHDKKVIAKADRLVRIDDGRIHQLGVRSALSWVVVRGSAIAGRRLHEQRAEPMMDVDRFPKGGLLLRSALPRLRGARGRRRPRPRATSVALGITPPAHRQRRRPRPSDTGADVARRSVRREPASEGGARVRASSRALGAYTYADPDALVARRRPPAIDRAGRPRRRLEVEGQRARRRRPDLPQFRFLSRCRQARSAPRFLLGRELHRFLGRGLGLPAGRAADRLGRSRRAVLRGRRVGARHARVPAAELRHHAHSAVGGARRVHRRRLARRVHLDSGADVRQYRQAGVRLLSGAAAVADAVRCRRAVRGSGAARRARSSNSNYGVRANTLSPDGISSAFYYRSFSTSPTFYRRAVRRRGQPFVFQPRYDRIWQAGGTVSKDLGEVVLRGEAVYAQGHGYAVADLTAAQSVVKRSTLDYIVSLEWRAAARHAAQRAGLPARVFRWRRDDLAIPRTTASAPASCCRPS